MPIASATASRPDESRETAEEAMTTRPAGCAERDRRMRILHVTPSYYPAVRYGGTTYTIHSLTRSLARRGHAVHVYTTNIDGGAIESLRGKTKIIDGVTVHYFQTAIPRIYWSWDMLRELRANMSRFDIVHAHGAFIYPTAAARRSAGRARAPFVFSPRGMLVRDMINRKSALAKWAWIFMFERTNCRAAAAIHATSRLEADELLRMKLGAGNIAVIPNGCDAPEEQDFASAEARRLRLIGQTGPYVLILGRVNWKKGIDRLIRAMQFVEGAKLVVAGNDEDNYRSVLEQIIRSLDLGERVRFTGPVYGLDKTALLSGAELFVLPSYSENFGVVVLEALACACPVVTTSEVGAAEAIRATGAGAIVDGAPERLGEAIAGLLARPEERKKMGEIGRRAVQELFSWESIAAQMEELYARASSTCVC